MPPKRTKTAAAAAAVAEENNASSPSPAAVAEVPIAKVDTFLQGLGWFIAQEFSLDEEQVAECIDNFCGDT